VSHPTYTHILADELHLAEGGGGIRCARFGSANGGATTPGPEGHPFPPVNDGPDESAARICSPQTLTRKSSCSKHHNPVLLLVAIYVLKAGAVPNAGRLERLMLTYGCAAPSWLEVMNWRAPYIRSRSWRRPTEIFRHCPLGRSILKVPYWNWSLEAPSFLCSNAVLDCCSQTQAAHRKNTIPERVLRDVTSISGFDLSEAIYSVGAAYVVVHHGIRHLSQTLIRKCNRLVKGL